MTSKKLRIPVLRRWKPRDLAYIFYNGRRVYFGKWTDPASKEKYFSFVQRLTAGESPSLDVPEDPTVSELVLAFFEARRDYYVRNGEQTRQLQRFRLACEFPLRLFPDLPVRKFGPRRLIEARDAMERSGRFSRTFLNTLVSCFRHVVKFGVEQELVPPDVLHALQAVAPLKKGRSSARENVPVGPVPAEDVDRTLPFLSPVLADAVRIQRLTGMRPGEVLAMKAGDVREDSSGVLVYTLRSDKTDYKRADGIKKRVPIGPKAARILFPYLVEKKDDEFLFSPADALALRRAELREKRRTPETKQTRERDSNRRPRPVAPCYNRNSYRQAIQRAAKRAGVRPWSPNQLRHLFATEVREKYGLEAAQACLGHARADVTQIYAERDFKKAEEVARREG